MEKIDFSEKRPRYRSISSLKHPRYYAYAVLLPDQSVLVLGGKTVTKGHMTMKDNDGNKKMIKMRSSAEMKSMDTDMEVPHDPHAVLERSFSTQRMKDGTLCHTWQ